jgi:hypothetical protein
MKRLILPVAVIVACAAAVWIPAPATGQGRPNIFAPEAKATPPLADVVQSMVNAFNRRNDWQIALIHGAVDTAIGSH